MTQVDKMLVTLGRVTHVIYDSSNDSSRLNIPLDYDTNYLVEVDPTLAKDVDGTYLISGGQDSSEYKSAFTTRIERGAMVGETTSTGSSLSGNVLKLYDTNFDVKPFSDVVDNDLNHRFSFTTSLRKAFTLKLQGSSYKYLEVRYTPWNSELFVSISDDNGYSSSNELLGAVGDIADISVLTVNSGGTKSMTIDFNLSSGEIISKSYQSEFSGANSLTLNSSLYNNETNVFDNFLLESNSGSGFTTKKVVDFDDPTKYDINHSNNGGNVTLTMNAL
jgi:hypothetical protein